MQNHGDSAAATGNHQRATLQRSLDGEQLDDGLWLRRRHHPAVAPLGVLHQLPLQLGPALFRLGAGVEGPDRLGGLPESRVAHRHKHLCHHRDHSLRQPASPQRVLQRLLEQITDATLGFGIADVQRQRRHLIGGRLRAEQGGAHLGPIAVRDHHAIARCHERRNAFAGGFQVPALFFDGAALAGAQQGIAANGDYRSRHLILLAQRRWRPALRRPRAHRPDQPVPQSRCQHSSCLSTAPIGVAEKTPS